VGLYECQVTLKEGPRMGKTSLQELELFRWGEQVGLGRQSRARRQRRLGFAAALAVVVEHGKRQLKPTALRERATARCPRCEKVGEVERDFGMRVLDGKRRRQSWCRRCRAAARATRGPLTRQELLEFDTTGLTPS
jgi:hypothetical protein